MIRRAVYDLKSPTSFPQILGRGDKVDVVLEDDVAQQREAALVLEELPGVQQDLHRFGPCEHRQPADDCAGQEMRDRRLAKPVSASSHHSHTGQGR